MTVVKTLGGDRLGAGKKQTVTMHGFERSTHDLGYIWRNTQAPGTLVPFMNMLALPGDTFDIDLDASVLTHPTVGPLFASFKLQLDVFQCPIRLYHAWLHNNKLKIGNDMKQVKLPLMEIKGNMLDMNPNDTVNFNQPDTRQINQSALLAYLGVRGLGQGGLKTTVVKKNAIPFLAYWDIYKNYYANKQEEIGSYIHVNAYRDLAGSQVIVKDDTEATIYDGDGYNMFLDTVGNDEYTLVVYVPKTYPGSGELNTIDMSVARDKGTSDPVDGTTHYEFVYQFPVGIPTDGGGWWVYEIEHIPTDNEVILNIAPQPGGWTLLQMKSNISLTTFPLENIDSMREQILAHNGASAFELDEDSTEPYGTILSRMKCNDSWGQNVSYAPMEGLALKTYQSDLFNNWLNTEWIDGAGGINEITAVSTAGDSFDINTLNLAQKVYDMLNRIAVSGGSYDDWMEAVYDHQGYRRAESPMYMGGLSKEIVFQEVVSSVANFADGNDQPLGTLAGRGTLAKKHKGGKVEIKVNEPSFIIGIVSITPRIDYSQGNDWTTLLKTLDDLHKPSLDEIGFQDLITDQMAAWDTGVNNDTLTLKSAGKQPAWINYMTNYNKIFGNFADENSEMFMTLARRYERDVVTKSIKDLTTYIDPTKYNYAFATTALEETMNFWVQIGVDCTARRKMSAKLMPNL